MARARTALTELERTIEKTLGDGNCAFNAFALALCDPYIFHFLEKLARKDKVNLNERYFEFIMRVGEALHVQQDWQGVKQALLALRKTDKDELQKKLAPVLREISINVASNPRVYAEQLERSLITVDGAFHVFKLNRIGKEVRVKDDIFAGKKHLIFVEQKFAEICNMTNDDECRNQMIRRWWVDEGYDLFLQAMRRNGEWAGDLELSRLAWYFDVVLKKVSDDDQVYLIHGDYGFLPCLRDEFLESVSDAEIQELKICLRSRGIISFENEEKDKDKPLPFNIAEEALLYRRLGKVPLFEDVFGFIAEHEHDLKWQRVPGNWPEYCLKELQARDVIVRAPDRKGFVFSVSANEARIRISEVPRCKEIQQICSKQYRQHAVLCVHHNYNVRGQEHWENTVLVRECEESIRRTISMVFFRQPQTAGILLVQPVVKDNAMAKRFD